MQPAPDKKHIMRILSAGLCAPDHGKIRPWRYLIIKGKHREAFAQAAAEAMKAADPDISPGKLETKKKRFAETPMVIALVMSLHIDSKIPVVEQQMSVAAGAMNVLNALHAENFAGFWVSCAFSAHEPFKKALGLKETQRLAGLLLVGTPVNSSREVKRPDIEGYAAFWKGEPVSFPADR